MKALGHGLRMVATVTVLAMLAHSGIAAADQTRILVLHSYNTDFRWTRDLDEGLRSVLNADPEAFTVIHTEYLDAKYFFEPHQLAAAAERVSRKYEGYTFDGIVAFDNIALNVLREYRDELFGAVPTVFAGINGYEPALTEGMAGVTGVVEALSVAETLGLIGELYPDGTRLWILVDGSLTSDRNMALTRAVLGSLSWRPDVRIVNEPGVESIAMMNAIESRASARGEAGGVAIILGSMVEHDGTLMDFWRAGRLAGSQLDIPVFSFWDFYLGTGIVGGLMTRGSVQGAMAGELMRQVLSGIPADEIPVVSESPNEWVFDRIAMRRFGLRPDALPEGSVVLNDDPTLWDEYALEIVAIILAVVVLVVLVLLLLTNIRRREEAATRLRDSLGEKEVLLREIHHRVKNNLQVISSILNLQSGFIEDTLSRHHFIDCESRVRSMALVHEHLYESTSIARIDMPHYLDELVSTVANLMAINDADYDVTRSVDSIELDLDTAIPVGLLVNELLSNAFKYAVGLGLPSPTPLGVPKAPQRALDGRGPVQIDVGFHRAGVVGGRQMLELSVSDTGPGLPADREAGATLGMELIDALSTQIGGRVVYSDNAPGVKVTISFPLPARSAVISEGASA